MDGRTDASILAALLLIGLSAALPAGVLYWLMRPTIVQNPGVSAYRPPEPDPLLPLISRATRDPYALSIAAAKRENELLQAHPEAAFALSQDAGPANSPQRRQHKRQRSTRIAHTGQQDRSIPMHTPTPLFNFWAATDQSTRW
jgi:hypothetical protein